MSMVNGFRENNTSACMKYYTQTELLNKKSEYSDRGVMGIYVLAD